MVKITTTASNRITSGIKSFKRILNSAISRDINESDTAVIVTDMFSDIFGYDKFTEITFEHAIQGAYCDLAIRPNGKTRIVVEIKAIGVELKDNHVRQGTNYATNEGCDWLILTNGAVWRLYKILFSKPISKELIAEVDFTKITARSKSAIEIIYAFSTEGTAGDILETFAEKQEILGRFFISAAILSDPSINEIRKQLRRASPGIKIDAEQIRKVIVDEVLKREVLEGDKAAVAQKRMTKAVSMPLRKTAKIEAVLNADKSIVAVAV